MTKMLAALILSSTQVFAMDKAKINYCQVEESSGITRTKIPYKPNYFFRTFKFKNAISYASDQGNFILDMSTNKHYQLPGIYDPVPVGEHVMSVPASEAGMHFYAVDEILKGNKNPEPLAVATGLKGVYQSVGLVSSDRDQQVYGVIVAGAYSTLYQEIQVSYRPTLQVQPLGQAIALCEGVDIKLPMLSKNASEISGFDGKTGTTKIWKIDHQTNKCVEVDDLGVFAGKADFSYDGSQLTFHIRGDSNGDTEYFQQAESSMSMNVFLYDRKTKKLSKISQGLPGDNAYYPVYRGDGSVIYAIVDKDGNPYFAHAEVAKIKLRKFDFSTKNNGKDIQSLLALGRVWNKNCFGNFELKTAESVLTAAVSLTPAMCKSLVDDKWNKDEIDAIGYANVTDSINGKIKFQKQIIQTLTKQDLIQACEELE